MDLYEILGIKRNATDQQIKKAYRRKAKKHHPDVGGDIHKWHKISTAYQVLIDSRRRKLYDEQGVTDKQSNNIEEEALSALHAYVVMACDSYQPGLNIIKHIEQTLMESGLNIKREIRKMEKEHAKLEEIFTRLQYLDGQESFIHRTIRKKQQDCRRQMAKAKHAQEVSNKMRSMIEGYDFDVTPTDINKSFEGFYTKLMKQRKTGESFSWG